MPNSQKEAVLKPVDSSVLNGSRKRRNSWIVFGVVVVFILTLIAADLNRPARPSHNYSPASRRASALRLAIAALDWYEKHESKALERSSWRQTLIDREYITVDIFKSTDASNGVVQYVMVTADRSATNGLKLPWLCIYEDPASLTPDALASILFQDGQLVQVAQSDLLNEIRKGLASRNLPYDAAQPGLQPAKSVAR